LLINRRSNFSYFPLAVSLFLIGCRFSPESEPRSNYLVVGIESNPLQIDPRYSTDANAARIGGLIYNSLLRADEHMRLQPELAERWTAPNDRTYLFDLRRDAKFHDGKTLTAEDVRYTYASILNPKSRSPKRGLLKPLDGIDVLGPHRMRFRLSAPHAPFLEQFTIGIVPEGSLGAESARSRRPLRPVHAGIRRLR
jgi:peptide/nickel transport system substrate-binding protein